MFTLGRFSVVHQGVPQCHDPEVEFATQCVLRSNPPKSKAHLGAGARDLRGTASSEGMASPKHDGLYRLRCSSGHPSIYLFISRHSSSICLSTHPPISLSIYPSIHLYIHPPIYLSIYLTTYRSICQFTPYIERLVSTPAKSRPRLPRIHHSNEF